ncbi:DUF7701 domain-containing protein [Actinomadura nitritigenes]|uniref:DUF7701 domain-containing protein n=1 Tax=Actinomadura nitritigenes TaxID=134602 RepID=UPI003D90D0C4
MTVYLEADADLIRSKLPVDATPPADSEQLFLFYAVLMRAKGARVSAEDVHNAWVAWMYSRDPQHEALIPYSQLNLDAQAQDSPYMSAIRSAARVRAEEALAEE